MILFSYVSLHRHNIERGQEMSWAPPWGCCLLWKKFSKSEEQNCMPPPPQFYSSIVLMYNSLVVSYHEFQIQYELSETLHLYWPCIYPNSFLLSRFNFPLLSDFIKYHPNHKENKIPFTCRKTEVWIDWMLVKKKFWSKFGKETKTQLLENFQLDSVIIYFLNSWKIWISTNWKELYLFKKGFYL